ncbi:MAG: arginase family protein [Bdellovibrio sp.]
MALGGGHDYAYPHVAGVLQVEPECLVLNFDAHLDCRPLKNGMNSGTPFRRLLEEFPRTSLVEIGVQQALNSPHHWKWLQEKGGQIYPLQFIQERGLRYALEALEPKGRPLFLSLDMDVFSSAYAPGCSASWPQGLGVKDFFQCLQPIFEKFRVLGMGIYEVSPPLDSDFRTCKLAAQILHSAMDFWRASS